VAEQSVGVLGALRGAEEIAFVTALERLAPDVVLTRRCGDLAELLAGAEAGLGRIAVLAADLPGLDRDAVAALHARGLRTVALAEPPEGWLAERTRALGVPLVVAPAEAVATVAKLAVQLRSGEEPRPPEPSEDTVEIPRLSRPGALVAVWGPAGAPGRTTVAVNLAEELAALGEETLLADADTYGGSVAQVLGLLDEAPGLAAAARAAGQGTLDQQALALLAPVLRPGLRVLTGISRAARWAELAPAALGTVWDLARGLAAWTVVDCGFCLEDDEALSYDTRAPRRNAATLATLAAADLVLAVGAADPVGVQRLVRGLDELAEAAPGASRVVLVNRVRASVVGPRPGEALAAALERYAGVTELRLVPEDRPALDAALLRGQTLRETAPGSPARKALAALATDLVQMRGGGAPRRASRRAAARR